MILITDCLLLEEMLDFADGGYKVESPGNPDADSEGEVFDKDGSIYKSRYLGHHQIGVKFKSRHPDRVFSFEYHFLPDIKSFLLSRNYQLEDSVSMNPDEFGRFLIEKGYEPARLSSSVPAHSRIVEVFADMKFWSFSLNGKRAFYLDHYIDTMGLEGVGYELSVWLSVANPEYDMIRKDIFDYFAQYRYVEHVM